MSNDPRPFWETKTLDQMTDDEWESVCDGCGRCCLHKLEDDETGEVHFTRVSCKLLDVSTCRCTDYPDRFAQVPDCLTIKPLTREKINWLPESCAYRRLSEGKSLENWHPLISGSSESVHSSRISVSNRCISETDVADSDYFFHLIDWNNVPSG